MTHRIRFIGLALVLLVAAQAAAQDVDAAREEFWLGNDAYVAGDYPGAVLHFEAAYRLAPNARVQEYLGRTYVAMGRYVEALEAFETAAEDAAEGEGELAAEIEATIAQLREDMLVRATGEAVIGVDAAVGAALGEQPVPQDQRRMELGTIMSDVTVQILSEPRGAEVFIDGTEFGSFGVTPLETPLFTGPHMIEVRLPYHEPQSRVVQVTVPGRGESIPTVRFELERQVVDAEVSVHPISARATFVADNGERISLGLGGFSGRLPAGPGTFVVQHAGSDRRVEAVVEAGPDGEPFTIDLAMNDDAGRIGIAIAVGTLIVVTEVDGADVSVDGRSIGTGPGEFEADLTPGPHSLRISLDGHEPFEQEVRISADSESTIYVNSLERARRR